MRKKKYLNERLADCNNLFTINTEDRNFNTTVETKEYIDFEKIFGNGNPILLEVGCGKGRFCREYARLHPEYNIVAVEKSANVIVAACEGARDLKNVYFISGAAEYLPRFIAPNTIERIFLNFSCPFPKKKYAVHRLTNARFLNIYKELLKDGGEIHQKTDNMPFFEYSIEEFTREGFALKNVSLDLHNSGIEENIMTEYEERFTNLGQPIYRLEAYINNKQRAFEK